MPVSATVEGPAAMSGIAPLDRRRAGPPALLLEHVGKTFVIGRHRKAVAAIADVSMRVERAEIYGVLGANGSGKSTLIRLVSTLLTIDTGRAEVFGSTWSGDEMAVKRLNQPGQRGRGPSSRSSRAIREPRLCRPPLRPACRRRAAGGRPDPCPARHLREAHGEPDRADEPGHAAEGRHRAGAADIADAPPPRRANGPDWTPAPKLEVQSFVEGPSGDPRRNDPAHDARHGGG